MSAYVRPKPRNQLRDREKPRACPAILAPPPVPCRPQHRHRSPPPRGRPRTALLAPAPRRASAPRLFLRQVVAPCCAPAPPPCNTAECRHPNLLTAGHRISLPPPLASSLPDEHFFLDYDAINDPESYLEIPPSPFADQGKSSNPLVEIVDHH
ncbi:hypothetical protein GUJ93_ZPchr0007g3147 [Zizania palustris]|uniref:Uncharacterized protein n=1 Tax=Zizania palustris TaxID=103762 RepID=A0A8J5TKH7_ZIZPA|nr:hypothetical protein GUJ93_ZPchr0007g3147 [Zizania palustris]